MLSSKKFSRHISSLLRCRAFVGWTLEGLFMGTIIYSFASGFYNTTEKGGPFDLGIACYTAIVLIVTARLTVDTSYWTWLSHLAIWGTLVLYMIFGLVYSAQIWEFMGPHAGDLYWIAQVRYHVCRIIAL